MSEQVRDPRTNTWTLFDDEKVTTVKGVNSHGPETSNGGGKAKSTNGDGTGKDKGKSKSVKKRGRGGRFVVADAESDAEVSFLGSSAEVG